MTNGSLLEVVLVDTSCVARGVSLNAVCNMIVPLIQGSQIVTA
jgi:hypothetical protein